MTEPDPLLDSEATSWPPATSIKLDDDEQFTQARQRLTQELRQMVVPPRWSDRGKCIPYFLTNISLGLINGKIPFWGI